MKWSFWKKPEPLPLTSAEQKLKEIEKILFPQLLLNTFIDDNGQIVKYHTDKCADSNLDAALMDLQSGQNDVICQNTINSVITRLHIIRKILDVHPYFDKDAERIAVENMDLNEDIEDIE